MNTWVFRDEKGQVGILGPLKGHWIMKLQQRIIIVENPKALKKQFLNAKIKTLFGNCFAHILFTLLSSFGCMKTLKAGVYKLTGKIRPTAIQANSNYTSQPAQQMRENAQSTWPLSHAQQMSNTICLLSSWLDTQILVTLPRPGIMVCLCLLDCDFIRVESVLPY